MRALIVLACLCALSACGFHLRGKESVQLPAELRSLRVVTSDRTAYPPLLIEMRNALRSQAGVELVSADAAAPTLTLFAESSSSDPVVGSTAYATAYILSYKVSFSLKDAAGREAVAKSTVRVQREYDADRTQNVIAKEKEADFLRAEMQRDAVQQILRRLASVTMPPATLPAAPATSSP